MLHLQLNEIHELMQDDGYDIIDTFMDAFNTTSASQDEIKILQAYKDGLIKLFGSKLDYRSDDENITDILEKIFSDVGTKILVTPIFVMAYKQGLLDNSANINKNFMEQFFNTQGNNNFVNISYLEISDTMFTLNKYGLFPDNIISKYVSSTSKDTLLHAKSLIENSVNGDSTDTSGNSDIIRDNFSSLVFNEDELCIPKAFNIMDWKGATMTDLIEILVSDMDTISKKNIINNFYIRNYLRPYYKLYWMKIEECINSIRDDGIPMLMTLVRITINEYELYKSITSKLVLKLLGIVLINDGVRRQLTNKQITILDEYHGDIVKITGTYSSVNPSNDIYNLMDNVKGTVLAFQNHGYLGVDSTSWMQTLMNISDIFDNRYSFIGSSYNDQDAEIYESCDSARLDTISKQATTQLLESFEVRKDGTIKVVLKGRTSLMDEYAANHRLLKLNDSTNDIESMKYNLVYALLIVESADRVLHNPKVSKSSSRYQDAEKAKSFATNDIVTYLPKVKLRDKNFDLNAFYKEVRADEYTIEVDGVGLVKGVKQIAKAVLS